MGNIFDDYQPYKAPNPYRTQKARGVAALSAEMGCFEDYQIAQGLLSNLGLAIFPQSSDVTLPAFARPCPTRPRHGFVESRKVETISEVLRVIAETQEADPNGEVIFMPRLSGEWSGVATHAGVTFGLRNDGATAGHSAVTIPSYAPVQKFNAAAGEYLCKKATIVEAAFLEFVEHEGKPTFVQVRNGPEVPRSKNYIPRETVVETVITVNPADDLLAWEKIIADAESQPGVVVHHPRGSLTTHFSVHALVHHIPVILDSDAPTIGATLVPEGWEPKALTGADYRFIAEWMQRRLHKGYAGLDEREVVMTTIGTLHACPQWGNDKHLLKLRAEGFAAILQFTAAACVGEVRHWYTAGPGCDGVTQRRGNGHCGNTDCRSCNAEYGSPKSKGPRDYSNCEPPASTFLELEPGESKVSRESVYSQVLSIGPEKLAEILHDAQTDLATAGWLSSFGGPHWAEAATLAIEGLVMANEFIADPCQETWEAVMSSYNRLLNAVHNNGAILTKWVSSSVMTAANRLPGPMFINSFAARLCLGKLRLPIVQPNETPVSLDIAA